MAILCCCNRNDDENEPGIPKKVDIIKRNSNVSFHTYVSVKNKHFRCYQQFTPDITQSEG